jgi:hypothetical protein
VDDNQIFVFKERSQQTLQANLTVDANEPKVYDDVSDLPGVAPQIAAGKVIDSYMLHADVTGEPSLGQKLSVKIGFDRDILGVIMTSGTLVSSDGQVGAVGTTYLNGPLGRRGLEMNGQLQHQHDRRRDPDHHRRRLLGRGRRLEPRRRQRRHRRRRTDAVSRDRYRLPVPRQ